jgi:hypothetical protein
MFHGLMNNPVFVAVTPAKLQEASRSYYNLLEGSGSIKIKYANSIGCENYLVDPVVGQPIEVELEGSFQAYVC